MSRVVAFPRRGPADRELADRIVGELLVAKSRADEDGLSSSVEHEGQTVATVRVVEEPRDDSRFRHRTVFVCLTHYGRSLVPLPWGR